MSAPLLTAEISAQVRQGAQEAAEAWQRAFNLAGEWTPGDTAELLAIVAQDQWNTPGLAVVLSQASGAYALLVADVAGALPPWIAAPDATGKSKLATLAQELGMVLLPEALMPTGEQTARLDNVQEALLRCEPAAGVEALALAIRCGDVTLPAVLVGCADAAKLLTSEPAAAAKPAPPAAAPATPSPAAQTPAAATPPTSPRVIPGMPRFAAPAAPVDFEDGIPALPSYTRSLLKISVPVVASLASTQIPVGRILEIGPGSIIQFDQSCEQPVSLAIGEHEFAVGEAVKVGEKFGLRITSMVMPAERFWSVRGKRE